jgi:enoyl-CoA hydratase/carnithine racemase
MMYVETSLNGSIAWVTINRPKTLNAIDQEVLQELHAMLDQVERDENVRVVIITGGGDKAFVAGGDIDAMRKLDVLEALKFVYAGHEFLNRLERSSRVFIAAVNGYALGGGTELALACDIRIASERAQFGLPEVTIGLYPGWGGTQRLPRIVGSGRAKELIFTGDRISAEEAYRIGLVNKVVPHEQLLETCEKIAAKIIANAPIAIKQAKKVIHEGLQVPLPQGLVIEAEGWVVNAATEDRVEGLTAFLEKRKPNFVGR